MPLLKLLLIAAMMVAASLIATFIDWLITSYGKPKVWNKTSPQYDSLVKRWRLSRVVFALHCACLAYGMPYALLDLMVGGTSPFGDRFTLAISGDIAVILMILVLPFITVFVPQKQGLVSLNILTRKYVIYGPGLHFRFPWESIHRINHISLENLTIAVEGLTIGSLSGNLIAAFQFSWVARLQLLDIFYQLGASTVALKFSGLFQEFLTSVIPQLPPQTARRATRILSWFGRSVFDISYEQLQLGPKEQETMVELKKYIDIDVNQPSSANKKRNQSRELEFGIDMESFEITDLDNSEKVQEAFDALAQAEKFGPIAMRMLNLNPDKSEDVVTFHQMFDVKTQTGMDQFLKLCNRVLATMKDVEAKVLIVEGDAATGLVGKLLGK